MDLCCGKGRHSIQMNQMGYQVTGVDLSEQSIKTARAHSAPGLQFHVHDMREPFAPESFDFILNLFTSFGYFSDIADNQKALHAVAQNLKANGLFVLDFLNANKVIREMIPFEEKSIEGITFEIRKELKENAIQKQIRFSDQGKTFEYTESVTAFRKNDLNQLFQNSGLIPLHHFGNYALEPFDEHNSDRLIIIAQKG